MKKYNSYCAWLTTNSRFTPPQDMIGANKGQQRSKFWRKRPDTGSTRHIFAACKQQKSGRFDQNFLAHPILWRCEPDIIRRSHWEFCAKWPLPPSLHWTPARQIMLKSLYYILILMYIHSKLNDFQHVSADTVSGDMSGDMTGGRCPAASTNLSVNPAYVDTGSLTKKWDQAALEQGHEWRTWGLGEGRIWGGDGGRIWGYDEGKIPGSGEKKRHRRVVGVWVTARQGFYM